MKIAIQGQAASYHALAARQLYGDRAALVYCTHFKDVFAKLMRSEADAAVVAIENSLYGSINEVYDLLLKHDVWIGKEAYEHIGLNLMSVARAKTEAITDVFSQAPALAEAEQFLDTVLPHAERHEYQDTALAAKAVAAWGDPHKAAIASQAAANEYGLTILANNIETHRHNYTRFIALQRTKTTVKKSGKFSLTFRTTDTPGSLHAALGVFAQANANLTKLESRPIVGSAWKYMYYADCTSDAIEPIIANLQRHATEIRLLGAYEPGSLNIL